jgi:hypothetical protein
MTGLNFSTVSSMRRPAIFRLGSTVWLASLVVQYCNLDSNVTAFAYHCTPIDQRVLEEVCLARDINWR